LNTLALAVDFLQAFSVTVNLPVAAAARGANQEFSALRASDGMAALVWVIPASSFMLKGWPPRRKVSV
jgi:hypothetical protein